MTIKEIANLAGVSASTVSKIINNKAENINAETQERVLKIVKEYNYVPYAAAIKSSTAKSFLIGILLKSDQSSSLVKGIMEILQKNGYRAILCNSFHSNDEELKNIAALQNSHVDGLIWEPVNEKSLDYEHYFTQREIPIQYINCHFRSSHTIDFAQIGYTATQALLNYNHRKIACLFKKDSSCSAMVIEGFKKCLFDNQVAFSNEMLLPDNSADFYSHILSNEFTGIISSHLDLALDFCEELYKHHYKIPYDLSCISLRDEVYENISFSKLSTILIPYYEFGKYVAQRLIAQCEKHLDDNTKFQAEYKLENTLSLDIPVSSRMPRIVVVGSINIDITLNVDELPQPGKTISANKSSTALGGKGANQAIGVSKLEYPVSLIGKVGNDYDASIIYNVMFENHVDASGITRDSGSETGKAYINLQNDGESTISIFTGANQLLSPKDIQKHKHLFKNASFCLLQTEIPEPAVLEAARIARAYNIKTILKPATLKNLNNELMQLTTIFIPNKKEACALCPSFHTVEEQADFFLKQGAQTVIITLGSKGCYVKNKEFAQRFPAIDFVPIDTTGAADAFIAALAVYLSSGYSLKRAVQIASYAAAFSITREGVVSSLIDKNLWKYI